MKAVAERKSVSASRSHSASAQTFFTPLQAKLTVNAPGDRHEQEADATAERIMRMPDRARDDRLPPADAREPERIQRVEAAERDRVQRSQAGVPAVTDAVQSGIRGQETGGRGLDGSTRQFMESRFGADFGAVRVHDDAESARLSSRLGARAFTTGQHIFFGADQYDPSSSQGRHLLAHELTHTIQQGAAIQRSPTVSTTTTPPPIQRFGIGDALDYFADKAEYLPGFRVLTIVLGFNPINRAPVQRNAGNVLRAFVELVPGASLVTSALESHGVFARAGAWVEAQIGAFADLGGQVRRGIDAFLGGLSWRDVFHLGGVWERAKALFTTPIALLKRFAEGLLAGLMELVRAAILRPLAELLRPTRGYDLLCAVLGRDPIVGEVVPRTADKLIGGFMKLIGREDIWENVRKGNAVARAWAWFQGALSGALSLVASIPGKAQAVLRSITWSEVATITGILGKVVQLFADLAGQFLDWALGTVSQLLEILFSVVAPGVLPYIKKAQTAFRAILDDPIGFVANLVRAGRLGFERFAHRIGEHLKNALVRWITGPLGEAGVYVPKSFDLVEILKLVLSALGLTWQNIRVKLVKIIPEPVLVVLEKTASVLVTLVKDGPAAAWEEIKAELGELKSMLIEKVTELVSTQIVKTAAAKVVGMLNPAGAVIQAILAIYETIRFFVERAAQIAETVGAYVNSIAAIAAGQVTAAAQSVEESLARTLAVVLSFLARFAGLGDIPQKLVALLERIRKPIDKGLDRIVTWLGAMLQKLVGAAKQAAARFLDWWKKKAPVSGGGEAHTLTFQGERQSAGLVLQSTPQKPSIFLTKFASARKVPGKDAESPIRKTVTHEDAIEETQASLKEYDDPKKAAPSGKAEEKANDLSEKLDGQLVKLGTHIGETLDAWGFADKEVGEIDVPRKSFTYEMKYELAETHDDRSDLARDSEGRLVNLKGSRKLARRHIVSSYDMSHHYVSALKKRKVSEAKLLLEQRGSAPESRTPVGALTRKGIEVAANVRHHAFFGYTKNLFIGDSAENSSIQEELDRGKPGMGEKKLLQHVSHIKRVWALDSSITISGLDT